MQEKELIKKLRTGDSGAQKALYDQYSSLLFAMVRRYVRSQEDAEDVFVDGMFKIMTKTNSFRDEGSFEGWMKRIMINESLGYIRKNKAMYLETDIEAADREPDLDKLSTSLEASYLLKMISEVPSGYRTIFNLYAIEGYSHKEIGELLGINENTSKSQLSRARAHLQKKLVEVEQHDEKKKISQDGK